MTLESVPVALTDSIRVFCVDCCRQASILWTDDTYRMSIMMHISCHGEERLILVPQIYVRRSEVLNHDHVDLLWTQLSDFATDADLEEMMQSSEADMLHSSRRMAVIESVLKSRTERRRK